MAWLMAYDIADRGRWRRVYRIACAEGFRLQYSLYWLPITTARQRRIEAELERIIDPLRDDIRFYLFPDSAWAWLSGPCPWPEGVQHAFSRRFATSWHGTSPRCPLACDVRGLPSRGGLAL